MPVPLVSYVNNVFMWTYETIDTVTKSNMIIADIISVPAWEDHKFKEKMK
jgi:hypothetical protein